MTYLVKHCSCILTNREKTRLRETNPFLGDVTVYHILCEVMFLLTQPSKTEVVHLLILILR